MSDRLVTLGVPVYRGQDVLPVTLECAGNGRIYYEPRESGAEKGIKERLDRWRSERKRRDA